jgi:hypothetical protein
MRMILARKGYQQTMNRPRRCREVEGVGGPSHVVRAVTRKSLRLSNALGSEHAGEIAIGGFDVM